MATLIHPMSRRKLHEKVLGLRRAGKTDGEIADILAITPSTIQYLAALFMTNDSAASSYPEPVQPRLKLAYDMRRSGKSFAEIGQRLQVSTARARQMIHRYAWGLRHSN